MTKIYRKNSKDAGILAIRAHKKCTIKLSKIWSLFYITYNYDIKIDGLSFISFIIVLLSNVSCFCVITCVVCSLELD